MVKWAMMMSNCSPLNFGSNAYFEDLIKKDY